MLAFLAELLSTIGMLLLAGEYVQGRRKWFNRALERFIINLVPRKLFTNSFTTAALPFVKDPVAGAFGLFRLQLGSIFGYVLVPLFIMFSLAGTVGTITRGDKAFQVDA